MINREIPFRPRLEGEFRVRFYNAASEWTIVNNLDTKRRKEKRLK